MHNESSVVKYLLLIGLLVWPMNSWAHTAPLDAYGCHTNKPLYGNTTTRECHAGLLAGQVFKSLSAEYQAYIAAQKTQLAQYQAQVADLQTQLLTEKAKVADLQAKLTDCQTNCTAEPPVDVPFKTVTEASGRVVELKGPSPVVYQVPGYATWIAGVMSETGCGVDLTTVDGVAYVQGCTQEVIWYRLTAQGTWDRVGALPPPAGQTATLNLSWNPNSETDLAGYRAYCGAAHQVYSYMKTVSKATPSTTVTLPKGKRAYCAVTAYDNANNESGYSNEVSAIP